MSFRIKLTVIMAGLGLCLGLAACDRSDERAERLQDIGEGVLEQIGGGDGVRDAMRSAPVSARALAGKIVDASEVLPGSTAPQKFVIGSIVAKPRQTAAALAETRSLDSAPTMADYDAYVSGDEADAVIVVPSAEELEQLEAADESGAVSAPLAVKRSYAGRRAITINPNAPAQQQTRALASREVLQDNKSIRPALPDRGLTFPNERVILEEPLQEGPGAGAAAPLPSKMTALRLMMPQAAMSAQLTAESRMIETAQRYGLAANIQRSRSGQMVIEVGSRAMSPTQFTGETGTMPPIAEEDGLECPDNPTAEQLQADPRLATVCVIRDLKASGEFEYVEKDWVYTHQFVRRPKNEGPITASGITPNDPLWNLQWNFLPQGSGEGQIEGGAGFVDFWTSQGSQGSSEVVVAVIDTGLELSHPDIQDSPNLAPGWDMVTDVDMANDGDSRDSDPNDPGDKCPEDFVEEDTYHGTHVAGTIGAGITNNAAGVAGGAWNVKIVPVRALGKCGGRLSDINDAIRWAGGLIPEYDELGNEMWNDNPADIINLSIGIFRFCPASMQEAINEVVERGVVVVAAAGNDKVSTQYYAPGGCNNVISVAAGDARGVIAPYSNYGDEVDVLAPGGDLSRDDNGDGRPDGILSTKTARNCIDPVTNESIADCFYAYEQGTSMAAPHVSAALALIKSKRPELSGQSLSDVLLNSLTARTQEQCSGLCVQYPGAEPIEGSEDLCRRPCGGGLLNMSNINLDD